MTEKEYELLNIIRNHNNPEFALITAVEIIVEYLNHLESSESILSVDSQESF